MKAKKRRGSDNNLNHLRMVDRVNVKTPDSAKLIQTKVRHQNESPMGGRGIVEGPNQNELRFELQTMDHGIAPDGSLDECGMRLRPVIQTAKEHAKAQIAKGSPSKVSPRRAQQSKPRKDLGQLRPIYIQGDGFERKGVQNQNTNNQYLHEVRNLETEVVGVNKNSHRQDFFERAAGGFYERGIEERSGVDRKAVQSNIKKLKNELALGGKSLLPQPEGWIEGVSKKKEDFQKDRERMVILGRDGAFGCREDRSYMIGRSTNHAMGSSIENGDIGIEGRFYAQSQKTRPDGRLGNSTVGKKVHISTENLYNE